MVLKGVIDESNLLWTNIEVGGLSNSIELKALIDTGFSGELIIPIQTAIQLGLTLVGTGRAELADGNIINQLLFLGKLKWGTLDKTIAISVSESDDTLIGGGLLHGYLLIADFSKGDLIIKEPGIDEPKVN